MLHFKRWLETDFYQGHYYRNPLQVLTQIKTSHPQPANLTVTFTSVNKVGINPRSDFSTPLGIYMYPLDYVIQNKMQVPFAGNAQYINVCELLRPQKILHMMPVKVYEMPGDLDDTSGVDFEEIKSQQKGLDLVPREMVDKILKEEWYNIASDYSILWQTTKRMSRSISQWNAMFRKLGIEGFVDHGTGTIHNHERTQCVIFQKDSIKQIHTIDQKKRMAKPPKMFKSKAVTTDYEDDDSPPLPPE